VKRRFGDSYNRRPETGYERRSPKEGDLLLPEPKKGRDALEKGKKEGNRRFT